MSYVHCCAGLRLSKKYSLVPEENFVLARMDYLDECPVCGHTVIQITKIDKNNKVSVCRKINEKARRLFDKLKFSILREEKTEAFSGKYSSNFYLGYNAYGVRKKCYSNLSSLKMGLFESKNLACPNKI